MRWISTDIETYLQAKKYVDTAFIPLIPIAFNEDLKSFVSMGEYCVIMANEIERQLHGRTLHIPPFTYLSSEQPNNKIERLQSWVKELTEQGFTYIFLITSDSEWKQYEQKLDCELIWLPAIPLEHMETEYKGEIISDQTKQLLQIVTNKWQI